MKATISDILNIILAATIIILILAKENTPAPQLVNNESPKKEVIVPSKEKVILKSHKLVLPTPIIIIGTKSNNKADFMTAAFAGIVSSSPQLLAIGIRDSRYTMSAIKKNHSFSISIPNKKMLKSIDYIGRVSGRDIDKSNIFNVYYGEDPNAPLISEAPASIECELVSEVDGWKDRSHHILIVKINNVHVSKNMLTDGRPDMSKINPIFYSMPQTKYFGLGDVIGKYGISIQKKD